MNGLPDPTKLGDHILEYLNTEDGQKRFSEGLLAAVDMDSLEQQLSKAMASYMEQAMGAMSESVAQAVEKQVQQLMGQITKAMENSMQQAMSQLGTNLQNVMENAISIDVDAFADAFQMNVSEEDYLLDQSRVHLMMEIYRNLAMLIFLNHPALIFIQKIFRVKNRL